MSTTGFNDQPSNTARNLTAAVATYQWDASSHNLKAGNAAFTLPSGLDSQQGNGHHTGALVPESVWSALTTQQKALSPYELERLVDVYYQFQAGPQSYNKFTALIDANGSIVQFDQPVNFSYVHSKANDINGADESEFYGKPFSLQYGGRGSLWGFPMEQTEGGNNGPRAPKFSLAVGADLGGGFKAVPDVVDETPRTVGAEQCAGVTLVEGELPALPAETPALVNNGARPSPETPVKVKFGELL